MRINSNSIRARLIRMQLVVAGTVLLLCTVAFIVYDLNTFRGALLARLESTAGVVGLNLEPTLSFMDDKEAEKILRSLKAEPTIVGARLFDRDGKPFAVYGQTPELPAVAAHAIGQNSIRFFDGKASLVHRLYTDGELLGTLMLVVDTGGLKAQARNYALIAFAVLLTSFAIAFLLARFMQRGLSHPIAAMAEITKRISASHDYSVRVGADGYDAAPAEIKTLAEELDRMIAQVQAQDVAIHLSHQVLEKKVEERTAELKETQRIALQHAHAAGVSEITTGTLHNVGNILNSVNISLDQIQSLTASSRFPNLSRAISMLVERGAELPNFLRDDPQGVKMMAYLPQAAADIESERRKTDAEITQLSHGIAMIKDVIASQQSYAKGVFMSEKLQLETILDDVLKMQAVPLDRHHVRVERRLTVTPSVKAQKAKLAHIILNLVKNAMEAMQACADDHRVLTVETGQLPSGEVYLRITDSGEGIAEEIQRKIFSHGFTTKRTGHGFGLHYCANAMVEMGGRLSLHSDGSGKGASFTLLFNDRKEAEADASRESSAA